MKRTANLLLLTGLVAGSLTAGELLLAPGIEAKRVMGDLTARQRKVFPGHGLTGSIQKAVLLTSGRRVYEARRGEWLDPGGNGDLAGLTMVGAELLATRGRELLSLSTAGSEVLARLPESDMRLTTSTLGDVVFLYGGRERGRNVYGLMPDGRYEKVVESDQPITALSEAGGELVFATGYELYLFARFGKPTLLLRSLQPILSVAVDPVEGTPYLATSVGVFVVASNRPLPLMLGVTGALHHDGKYLIVSDPVARTVVALEAPGTTQAMAGPATLSTPKVSGPAQGFLK